jgi:hypothetical protein
MVAAGIFVDTCVGDGAPRRQSTNANKSSQQFRDGRQPGLPVIRPKENSKPGLVIEAISLRGTEKHVTKLIADLPLEPLAPVTGSGVVQASGSAEQTSERAAHDGIPFRKCVLSPREARKLLETALLSRVTSEAGPQVTASLNRDSAISLQEKTKFLVGYVAGEDGKPQPLEEDLSSGVAVVARLIELNDSKATIELQCEQCDLGPLQKMHGTGPNGKGKWYQVPERVDKKRCHTVCDVKPGDCVLLTGFTETHGKKTESLAILLRVTHPAAVQNRTKKSN